MAAVQIISPAAQAVGAIATPDLDSPTLRAAGEAPLDEGSASSKVHPQPQPEDSGVEKLQLLADAIELPRFAFTLPMSSYGSTMVIPMLVSQPTVSEWVHYSGMTYFGLVVNYIAQGTLVFVLYWMVRWAEDGIAASNAADDGSCFKLITALHLVCVWLHTSAVLKDLKETLNMTEVLCNQIPTVQGKSQLFRFAKENGAAILRGGGMSKQRKACLFLCLIVPKFVIALLILVFGGFYLGSSGSNADLILNSLAIIFIMDVDEMVTQFLAPARIVRLLEAFPPFECQSMPWYWTFGQEYSTAINMAISALIVGLFRLHGDGFCDHKWPSYDERFFF